MNTLQAVGFAAVEKDRLKSRFRNAPEGVAITGSPLLTDEVWHCGCEQKSEGVGAVLGHTVGFKTALKRLTLTGGPLLLGDIVALAVSAIVGLLVASVLGDLRLSETVSRAILITLCPALIAFASAGLYPGIAISPVEEFRLQCKSNGLIFLTLAIAAVSTGAFAWGLVFSIVGLCSLVLVPIMRAVVRNWCSRRSWWGYPTMIFSAGATATKTLRTLRLNSVRGLRPVALVVPEGSVLDLPELGDLPILDRPTHAIAFSSRHSICYGVVSLPQMSRSSLDSFLEQHAGRIPRLLMASQISNDVSTLWRSTRGCDAGIAGVEQLNTLHHPFPTGFKRVTDLLFVIVGGLLISPFLLALAVAVKLTSRGPIFYGQWRIGQHGRRFRAWKFRTMRSDADEVLQQVLSADAELRAEWARDHKLKKDPRITRIGRFLRKSSLDELAQLYNVLIGDMSLVGPRPIVEAEVIKYADCFKYYTMVRPGITGLWQVSGRNLTSYDERVELDNAYVRNWSPWVDIHILGRTVDTIVARRGAF